MARTHGRARGHLTCQPVLRARAGGARRRHPRRIRREGHLVLLLAQRGLPHYRGVPEAVRRGVASWRLKVHGLVDNPVELSLDDLRALPPHEQITQHYCIQGWSGIARWAGVSMATIVDLVK